MCRHYSARNQEDNPSVGLNLKNVKPRQCKRPGAKSYIEVPPPPATQNASILPQSARQLGSARDRRATNWQWELSQVRVAKEVLASDSVRPNRQAMNKQSVTYDLFEG